MAAAAAMAVAVETSSAVLAVVTVGRACPLAPRVAGVAFGEMDRGFHHRPPRLLVQLRVAVGSKGWTRGGATVHQGWAMSGPLAKG